VQPRRAILGPVSTPKRRATYEDLCRVPDHMVAEIIDGELFASPRPAAPHALAATMLGSALVGSFGGDQPGQNAPGGWWILLEPELHFGDDVVVPDWAGWRRERMPTVPDVAFFTQAPDWVCEVISPSTGVIDRGRKMRVYAREQVGHLWIADPTLRTLEVYRLEEGRWVVASTHAGTEEVRAEPFDAVALDMRRWWREP
jgi:Uma2 family endonuclease